MSAPADVARPSGDRLKLVDERTKGAESAAPFVANWELDLSGVRSLIDEVSSGRSTSSSWFEELVNGARIVGLDERAAQVVGAPVPREEMIGRSAASFAPPFSWPTLAELIVAVATDRPQHAEQVRPIKSFMLREARLKVWAQAGEAVSSRVLVAVEGEVADDRSPWAVRASEQRYRRLIQHLPNALLQVDGSHLDRIFRALRDEGVIHLEAYIQEHPDFVKSARKHVRITDANESAVKLFGAPDAASLVGPIDLLYRISPDAGIRTMIARFEGKRNHSEPLKLLTFDGRTLDVLLSVTYPNSPEYLDVALATLEDVTERLQTEAQLRQLQAEHSRATRIATLGELASSIAHEVNQPLAAIAMNAKTSLRWLLRHDPNLAKVAQLTERIAASAHHASGIVQRIRSMAARHAPERIPLDLNEVVKEALLFVRHDLDARGIKLVTDLRSGLPIICGDRVQLQQVIVNLVLNGIQAQVHNNGGGGLIELRTGPDEGGAVGLSIRDEGSGIAPENLDRIFDGFFTTKDDGMGIGLSVCQSIIVVHGGRISADNHPEGGAVFHVTLPACADVKACGHAS